MATEDPEGSFGEMAAFIVTEKLENMMKGLLCFRTAVIYQAIPDAVRQPSLATTLCSQTVERRLEKLR